MLLKAPNAPIPPSIKTTQFPAGRGTGPPCLLSPCSPDSSHTQRPSVSQMCHFYLSDTDLLVLLLTPHLMATSFLTTAFITKCMKSSLLAVQVLG